MVMGELATAPEDLERYRERWIPDHNRRDGRSVNCGDRRAGEKTNRFIQRTGLFPGASVASAALDIARTTCRRAERRVAALVNDDQEFNIEILRYLNRLSDLCWLLARKIEHGGTQVAQRDSVEAPQIVALQTFAKR